MKNRTCLLALALAGVIRIVRGADAAANWTGHGAKCRGEGGKGNTTRGRKRSIADLSAAKVQATLAGTYGVAGAIAAVSGAEAIKSRASGYVH